MVHAELGDKRGDEAVYTMMLWSDGRFAFDPDIATEVKSIRQSNANLLIEGVGEKTSGP